MAVNIEYIGDIVRGTRDGLLSNNPSLPPGTMCMESDTGRKKVNKSKVDYVNWNNLAYEDPTFRLSEFNSIVDAIYFIGDQVPVLGNRKVRPTLIVDKDVVLPAGANYIIDFKVVVEEGCEIAGAIVNRTMDGKTPIVGTVPASYAQITFRGKFEADPDQQVFRDDVLVWFANNSVSEVHAEWWGIKKGSNISEADKSSNVKALQYAALCVIESRSVVPDAATKYLRLGSGDICLNAPIVLMKCGLNGHPFLTGKRQGSSARDTKIILRGLTPIKHERHFTEVTNIIYTANYAAPFIVQAGRDVVIENFRIEGVNDVTSKDTVNPSPHGGLFEVLWNLIKRNDNFSNGEVSEIGWISNNIKWNRHSPYAAIITDPFNLALSKNTAGTAFVSSIPGTDYIKLKVSNNVSYVVNELDQYLDADGNILDSEGKNAQGVDKRVGVDGKIASGFIDTPIQLYYGRSDHQNGWQAVFGNMHMRKFVSGICQTLTAQQGDTYTYHNLQFQMLCFGISTCQDQSRDCTATKVLAYGSQGGVHSIFENVFHGQGKGVTPKILDVHTAGGCKYIVYGADTGRGSVGINNIYAESIYDYVQGGGSQNYPAHITNCDLKRDIVRTYTHPTHGTGFLPRNSDLTKMNVTNSMIGAYVEKPIENKIGFMLFDTCTFKGCTTGPSLSYLPLDKGWFQYVPRNTNSYEGVIPVNGITNPTLDNIIWFPLKGTNTYECIDGTESIKITIPDAGNLAEVDIMDICRVTTNINMPLNAAIVFEKGSNYIKIGGFRSEEYYAVKNELSITVGNPGLLLLVENQNYSEFYGTKNSSDSKIVDITYAVGYGNMLSTSRLSSSTTSTVGSMGKTFIHDAKAIMMPNGQYYRVQSHSSTQLILRREYSDTISNSLFTKSISASISGNWINGLYGGTTNEAARFYIKGYTYPKIVSRFNSTIIGFMKCLKTGGFNKTSDNLLYTATFLEYDLDNKLVAYVTSASRTVINHSGTTAQKPDTSVIPLPSGFIYKNTTTSLNETWNGSEWFVTSKTIYLTQAEYDALTPDPNTTYIIIG